MAGRPWTAANAVGYPMALALIVVSALLPLLWFKKRGWM